MHRIDKDTSGLLVVAKTPQAHVGLSNQLMDHSMTRSYVAIVEGNFEHITGTVDAPLARDPHNRLKRCVQKEGKQAITHFTVIQKYTDGTIQVQKCKDSSDTIYLFTLENNLFKQLNMQGEKLYTTYIYNSNNITIEHHNLTIKIVLEPLVNF